MLQQDVDGSGSSGLPGPVVRDLVSSPEGRCEAVVSVCSSIQVVSLPGGVTGLEQNV